MKKRVVDRMRSSKQILRFSDVFLETCLRVHGAMTSSAAVSTSMSGEGRVVPPTPAIAESNRFAVFRAHNGGRGENSRHRLVAKPTEVGQDKHRNIHLPACE